jgi:DNA (cytosine-5)-methyltransferase 1
MQPSNRPLCIDLFAGAGGLSLGFEQAGFDIAAAVEIDPIHAATHEFNFPLTTTICKSVIETTGAEIRQLANVLERDIDVVCGGAPCQGFSLMGKRALDDPRNSLVFHFLRIVTELQPKYFVLENVKGLTIGKHQRFLQEIIETFAEIGYHVLLPYRVLNAADFGVPQDRHRLFLIGARVGQKLPKYPTPLSGSRPSGSPTRKGRQDSGSRTSGNPTVETRQGKRTTVWEAIGDLPDADQFPELIDRDWVKAIFSDGSEYAQKMRGLLNDPENYGYIRDFNRDILTSSLRTEHTKKIKQRFADTPMGKTESISRFLKLNPDGLCNTLRAGTGSDRGAHTSPRPIHPYLARCITVREAARLHSYPDWFRFHATKWHGCRQIGNSVPPLLARAVAKQIIQAMDIKVNKPSHKIQLDNDLLLLMKMGEAATKFQVAADIIPKRTKVLFD